jgi:hypothetical protein
MSLFILAFGGKIEDLSIEELNVSQIVTVLSRAHVAIIPGTWL